MLVADYMTKPPITIDLTDSLATADDRMRAGGFRHLPVVQEGRLVGILADRDLREHVGHLKDTRVTGAMTADPLTVTPTTTLQDAAREMLRRKLDSLPVVDDMRLVGIITTSNVLRAFLRASGAVMDPDDDQC